MRYGIDAAFWRKRRVFVTGHTGFKGSWLVSWLAELGAEVCGYALEPPTRPSAFEALGLAGACDHRIGDIRDRERLAAAVRGFRPDVVIHMAAQPLVRLSYEIPLDTFEVNVMGTANLLQACRGVDSIRSVVVVTSDKCYENREWPWAYRECDALGGHDPYSASKACAEIVASAFRNSYFSAHGDGGPVVASARAGNVIGGGDWSRDRLVPDAARAFSAGEGLVIRRPDAIRPWQFVLEPLAGYLMLARACFEDGAAFAQGWNFGPRADQLLTVAQVVELVAEAWGGGARWEIRREPDAGHEAGILLLDAGLANRRLGWTPQIRIADAIRATVDWYQCFHGGGDLAGLTRSHIERFRGLASGEA